MITTRVKAIERRRPDHIITRLVLEMLIEKGARVVIKGKSMQNNFQVGFWINVKPVNNCLFVLKVGFGSNGPKKTKK
jgi:hypothetical protein